MAKKINGYEKIMEAVRTFVDLDAQIAPLKVKVREAKKSMDALITAAATLNGIEVKDLAEQINNTLKEEAETAKETEPDQTPEKEAETE